MSVLIADVNLKFDRSKLLRRNYKQINKIILHHSASNHTIKQIHAQHLHLGWAGIGYHFFISKDGVIYRGRPAEYVGSHCRGNNANSIGICLQGDFRKEKPTQEQLLSMSKLIKDLKNKYQITGVFNHRDLFNTLCPVVDLKNMILEGYE